MYVYIFLSLRTYVYTCIHEFVDKETTKAVSANKNIFKDLSRRKNFGVKSSVSAVKMCVWAGAKINTTLPYVLTFSWFLSIHFYHEPETPTELRCNFYTYVVVTDSAIYKFGVSTSAVIPLVDCMNAADNVIADVDMYCCGHVPQKRERSCGRFSA